MQIKAYLEMKEALEKVREEKEKDRERVRSAMEEKEKELKVIREMYQENQLALAELEML